MIKLFLKNLLNLLILSLSLIVIYKWFSWFTAPFDGSGGNGRLILLILFFGLFFVFGYSPFFNIMSIIAAKQIMSRGGPKTLGEYLCIFPDACKKCGSRYFSHSWTEYTHYDTPIQSIWICNRCQTVTFEDRKEKVGSPYLSQKRADAIPDFPYEK